MSVTAAHVPVVCQCDLCLRISLCISQIRRRRVVTRLYADNGNYVESLEYVQKRVLFVMIGIAILVIIHLIILMLRFYDSNLLESSFEEYVFSVRNNRTEIPKKFRKYLHTDLMLFESFLWPCLLVVLIIFISSYKDVRELWLWILTCGVYHKLEIQFNRNKRLPSNGSNISVSTTCTTRSLSVSSTCTTETPLT